MTATASRFTAFPVLSRLPVLLVLTVALLGSVLSGAASAHSTLTGSDPKDGAVVATAPQRVTLTFSEQVAMGDNSIRVLEPSGKRADVGELQDRAAARSCSTASACGPG